MKSITCILSICLAIALIAGRINPVMAGDCSVCDNKTTKECLRILSGNGVDIYYGYEKPCPEEDE